MALSIATSNIVAMAFAELEIAQPSSFAEDSDVASDAAVFYAQALDEVLQSTDWGWASRLADLPPLDSHTPADTELPFAYAVPPECLALRQVGDDWTHWREDQDILRVNAPDSLGAPGTIRVRFTRRIDNEERVPPMAKRVIALSLAQLMLPRWGNSAEKRRLEDSYDMALRMARRANARGGSSETWTGRRHPDIVGEVLR